MIYGRRSNCCDKSKSQYYIGSIDLDSQIDEYRNRTGVLAQF